MIYLLGAGFSYDLIILIFFIMISLAVFVAVTEVAFWEVAGFAVFY